MDGVGFYFRNVTELVLFGVRAGVRTLARDASSQFSCPRKREHSRKPDELYDIIEMPPARIWSCLPGTRGGLGGLGDEAATGVTPQAGSARVPCEARLPDPFHMISLFRSPRRIGWGMTPRHLRTAQRVISTSFRPAK